ncbi:hypothetical protein PBY51_018770 [Eleginops maclovinus]|uniref:Uncharacterized protein n=1 Tax=Eleginops maclovinus TaxID=56733 RepID=A0AAN8AYF7_ELEMC|nr:hypothetical protein PBY51_018770 [Eleginops maclovinus]
MERFMGGGEMEMSGEKSGEVDNLVQSVVDDLRKKKGRGERHHQATGRESRRGVVTGESEKKNPLPERRSRLSSASSRNASEQKWSHKLTAWKI